MRDIYGKMKYPVDVEPTNLPTYYLASYLELECACPDITYTNSVRVLSLSLLLLHPNTRIPPLQFSNQSPKMDSL